ncbi:MULTISPECIES: CYTH and CHAD domain-containing protein [unclassified Campylobacter]|uniref:CYTH and CHAD domain-containing protein n=1 Tax=unclassified Campylobacter TaxID=2593542 RepID=UPI0022E9DB99|nr:MULTISPECIES: CHAD domain-containing protein [unclassified Campylobacter]MDA3079252.1 CHAD domain-containing protein [Campylobacter sp. CS_NA2]MDA3080445.1 CHAD domain-containing protein [Campylobacter sp. CS_NA1]MDA3085350.1 CHAD domain-containing protein [Campylobacter sp. CS_ED1]MDA3090127.1 CHAD domain-containing protein [Campylobacter sp. CS_ED2]WBR51336.1 CHAD domain-containing protein [Campylobacter sp. CS_NA3]
MQIERKFLFSKTEFLAHNTTKFQKDKTQKFYISLNPQICYIKSSNGCFLSHKKENLQIFTISKDEFKIAQKDKIIPSLKYDAFKSQNAEFRIYKGGLSGVCIAKVLFENENLAKEFDTNSFFSDMKFSEISNLNEFDELNLALFGTPLGKFDTKKAWQILRKNKNLTFKIPAYLDSFEAIILILRLIFDDIKNFKNEFLDDKNGESLHKFRISLRKFRAVLKQSRELFEPNFCNEILKILKIIANKTNEKRDLEIFHKKLSFLNTPNLLLQTLKTSEEKASLKLENFFKSENFELFLKTLEAFLSDENRRFGVKEYEKRAKKFIAILLLNDIKKLKTELKNLNENSQNSDFHAIRIKIKNLRYALEYFTSTFNQKSLKELSKISKRSQEIFGNLQDIDLWLKFIQIYQNSLKNQNEISTFLCSFERLILGHSVKIKQNILENKAKFIKILNKNIKFLKIYKEI